LAPDVAGIGEADVEHAFADKDRVLHATSELDIAVDGRRERHQRAGIEAKNFIWLQTSPFW